MPQVAATFSSYSQLEAALGQLEKQGFDFSDLEITQAHQHKLDYFPDGYDPIGGARFTGGPIGTMAATGMNLVGNSINVDEELNKLPQLLNALANEPEPTQEGPGDFLLTIETDH